MIRPDVILAQARSFLQDMVQPYRFSDDTLLVYLNMGLKDAKRIRPDLFLTIWGPVPTVTTGNLTTPIDVEEQFENAFAMFIVGAAELAIDEFTQDSRAVIMSQRFVTMLTTAT